MDDDPQQVRQRALPRGVRGKQYVVRLPHRHPVDYHGGQRSILGWELAGSWFHSACAFEPGVWVNGFASESARARPNLEVQVRASGLAFVTHNADLLPGAYTVTLADEDASVLDVAVDEVFTARVLGVDPDPRPEAGDAALGAFLTLDDYSVGGGVDRGADGCCVVGATVEGAPPGAERG